jgi:hypothetical protein
MLFCQADLELSCSWGGHSMLLCESFGLSSSCFVCWGPPMKVFAVGLGGNSPLGLSIVSVFVVSVMVIVIHSLVREAFVCRSLSSSAACLCGLVQQ